MIAVALLLPLNDRQTDVQERDGRQDTDETDEVNGGEAHSKGESERVEKLDLNEWALPVEVEFDDADGVHENYQA